MTTETNRPTFGTLPDDALVRINQVIPDAINVGKSTFYRWVQQGAAPAPVHPNGGAAMWHVGTLRKWIRSRATAR
jgi:predicted DNA-binding transcriptional regulator AlpA